MEEDKIIILIDPEVKKKFQIRCIENGTNMSTVLRNFIYRYIGEGEDHDGTDRTQ